jgi:hypothetical protein
MTGSLQDQLLNLMQTVHPRGLAQQVKLNKELSSFVDTYWCAAWGDPCHHVEKIWYAAHGKTPICDQGNRLGWASITKGSTFCAKQCACAQQQRKHTMKARYGEYYQQLIQQKIEVTLNQRYGVSKLSQVNLEKKQATNMERYGAPTPLESKQVQARTRESCAANHGTMFPFQQRLIQEKIQQAWYDLTGKKAYAKSPQQVMSHRNQHLEERFGDKSIYLVDKDLFVQQLRTQSRQEMSLFLGCSISLIDKRIAEWDLTEFQSGRSHYETVISNFLTTMEIDYQTNNRQIIGPQEIDWWIPSHRLGIEFGGLRWHGERVGRTQHYHLAKLQKMSYQGHGLIQIFQDEWDQKSHIVKSIIQNRLGVRMSKSVMARKCSIVDLTQSQLQEFLDQNHLYGSTRGDMVRLGLIHDQTVVAVMSFRKHRQVQWEVSRFAVLANHVVSGGFSKLFSHFQKTHQPKEVISYVDLRYFSGHSLSAAGFEHVGSTPPGYWYTKGVMRYHRLHFTKARLIKQGFDPAITEKEIMESQNYDKIWDCGHDRWTWTPNKQGARS